MKCLRKRVGKMLFRSLNEVRTLGTGLKIEMAKEEDKEK